MRKISLLSILLGLVIVLSACTDADIASNNLSKAADNFEINRRIVFYNGITDTYLLTIEGRCSLGNQDDRSKQVTVTCKTGDEKYKKHFLGLSDNVTYFAEQLETAAVSVYHYRVTFKPEAILPDIDLKVNGN
ncbi:beta-sandwich lipoprotein [Paenibacillus medicaginis]|uniref:Lipoprotein n=1 Tax=Paenibacillus medicaginis TaxID=1470560 RepID=A0ABV5BUL9_9BACL